MRILYEQDLTGVSLRGRRVAVIGYGSQGEAQALNLRDSGVEVIVGLRSGSPARPRATAAGLRVAEPAEAARQSEVVMLLLPDERQPEVYAQDVAPHLKAGAYVGFAHGFAVHFRKLVPAAGVNVFLVAPKGVGPMVRQQYLAGGGVACLVAVHQDPRGDTRAVALAYAAALGCGQAGILETTFREEAETDLFGEQAVLCGGMIELIRAAFETLVAAGYAPELAYFECLHEVKLIADLVHARGISGMQAAISHTAKFGGLTRGPRVVGTEARGAMQAVLAEIRSGQFAEEWMAEHAAGEPRMRALLAAAAAHPLDAVGAELRAKMPWLTHA